MNKNLVSLEIGVTSLGVTGCQKLLNQEVKSVKLTLLTPIKRFITEFLDFFTEKYAFLMFQK